MKKEYTKICNKCGEEKPISEFHKRLDRKCGLQSRCKKCQNIIHSEWVSNNLTHKRESQIQWKISNPKRYWCNKTINHHKDSGFNINITTDELLEYITSIDTCELCGKQLSFFNKKTSNDSPSLDRIDNEQFISIKNIQLLCHQCNTSKGARTQNEFEEYCKLILRRKGYDI